MIDTTRSSPRRLRRRPDPVARCLGVRVGRQRPRRAPELSGTPRARPPPDRQCRPGDQGQLEPAVRHVGDDRRDVPASVRRAPACRGRCSCRATTCRAVRPSGRSRRRASASRRSTSAIPQLSMHSARELCGADDPRLPRRRPRPTSSVPRPRLQRLEPTRRLGAVEQALEFDGQPFGRRLAPRGATRTWIGLA